ncbi:MAG: PilZ domain-containing protein [Alphaproteobacteria bacterium]|nr:PilZ domain-containing protein [Alphaproteobacteria bacterium]
MVTPFRRILIALQDLVAGGKADPFESLRDFARSDVDVEIKIFFAGKSDVGRMRDVSMSGAMVESELEFPVGAVMELELPAIPGRVGAEVVWVTDDGTGIRFQNRSSGLLIAGWSRGTSTAPSGRPLGPRGR